MSEIAVLASHVLLGKIWDDGNAMRGVTGLENTRLSRWCNKAFIKNDRFQRHDSTDDH